MDNTVLTEVISVLFGAGGVVYAIATHFLDRKKFAEEVRQEAANADLKTDEFWKNRYDVLNAEMQNKDIWWKERYDNLYTELQEERKLSNEIIKNFRTELNEIREDYEKQHEADKQKYNDLMTQYEQFQDEVNKTSAEQIKRINQLEELVSNYENRLKVR